MLEHPICFGMFLRLFGTRRVVVVVVICLVRIPLVATVILTSSCDRGTSGTRLDKADDDVIGWFHAYYRPW
jgi:hypothetical protein